MNASTPSFNKMERLVTLLASYCLKFTTYSQKNELSLKVCGRHDRRIYPLATFMWGYLKGKVYANNPKTLEDLKENIQTEIRRIGSVELHRV
jgi:hypothetical protein